MGGVETTNQTRFSQNIESEAISRLRNESSMDSNNDAEHYESMYVQERGANMELRMNLRDANYKLRTSCNLSSAQLMIENLESQVEIGLLRVQDLD